jgi:hypothetical protein
MYTGIFKNAYKVIKTEEGYFPVRFTDKQLEYYKNLSKATEDRSLCTAGICMDFYTDAECITFSYRADHFSRRYVGFDFYENGIFKRHIEEALDTKQSTLTYPLTEKGIKRVTVYVPNLSRIRVYDLDIGNFQCIKEQPSQKLLFLGDSITQGMVALSPSLALPGHTMELADALNQVLSEKWTQTRGIAIGTFGISSLKASEEDEELIKKLQRSAVMRDPTMAAATLVGAQSEAMVHAAQNEGAGPVMAFAGMNLAGQAGGMNASNLYAMGGNQQGPNAPDPNSWTCSCGTVNKGKFCGECGKPKPVEQAGWTCECGTVNKGKFCGECGKPKPAGAKTYKCDKCGWDLPAGATPPKFCPECGDAFNDADEVK